MAYSPGVNPISGSRNAFINGDVSVCQLPQFAGSPLNIGDTDVWENADMWGISVHGGTHAGSVTDNQASDHPLLGTAGFCKQVAAVGAIAAPAAADACTIFSSIEGFNFQRMNLQTCVVQFWAKSAKAGTHCFALVNWGNGTLAAGAPVSYVVEYKITAADTWQQIILGVTFNSATAFAYSFNNDLGIRAVFPLYCGTTWQTATPNVWNAGRFYATANQQNLLSANGKGFQVTDLQIELGIVPTVFERDPFDEQLVRCQRYYQSSFLYGVSQVQNKGLHTGERYFTFIVNGAAVNQFELPLLTRMNSPQGGSPAFTFYNPAAANAQARDITNGVNCTATGLLSIQDNVARAIIVATGNAATGVLNVGAVHFSADARI